MKKLFILLPLSITSLLAQPGISNLPLSAQAPQGVQQEFFTVTLTPPGTTTSTARYYHIVAHWPIGAVQSPIGPVVVANPPFALSGSNYVTISWNPPASGVVGLQYDVLESSSATFPNSCTSCTVITGTTNVTVNDIGSGLGNYTYTPAGRANEQLALNNRDWTSPYWELINNSHKLRELVTANQTYTVQGNATIAQVNAGFVVLPIMLLRTVTIEGFVLQAVGGSVGGCTAVQIDDTTGTPVVGVSVTAGTLMSGVIVNEATSSGVTLTTFLNPLTIGQGLQLLSTGSTCTTATSINYRVFYTIN